VDPEAVSGPGHALAHTRGMATFVLVRWDEADTHPLNQPVEVMDYWITG
jgi:hypothetical protein